MYIGIGTDSAGPAISGLIFRIHARLGTIHVPSFCMHSHSQTAFWKIGCALVGHRHAKST